MDDLWKLGVADLNRAYAEGATDPLAVTQCCLERIAALDPQINAFVCSPPQAEAEARESMERLRAGAARSPIEGVPLAIKDNLVVRGMPAAWGSTVFGERVHGDDELPIRRLREAGAIFLGKTATPEFAVEGYTASARYGVTRNPWNPALTPGGSSGGSAAAVAAGLAPAGIGTDGGGSTRRPAGHTGLYGLKPTIGAVPRSGGLPQVLLDFEVVGMLARSASDLRLLFGAMAGQDRRDPASRWETPPPHPRRPLRILYAETLDGAPCDPVIRASVGAAADRLAALGHEVVKRDIPLDLAPLNAFWPRIAQIGLAAMRQAVPDMIKASPQYLAMADEGDGVSAPELYAALDAVRSLRASASSLFAGWDAVMTPTAAAQPWPAHEPFPAEIDGEPVGPRGHAVFTGWVNAAGLPGVALPADPDRQGLPVGFQLVGDLRSEALLLDLAVEYQAASRSWTWPSLACG